MAKAEPEISKILETYFQASGSLQRRNTLYQSNWSAGCEAYTNKDFDAAIAEFQKGDHSKMMYNAGMSYLSKSDYSPAKEAFSRALGKDRFFALGWFQRGYCNYLGGDYPTAFQDFIMAKKLLHENTSIDYSKIGCKFELKKTEILFNVALVHLQLGNLDEASKAINEGKSILEKGSRIDFDALRTKGTCTPFFSPSEIFHPPILANAAKQRANTNPDKAISVVKDELADSLRQRIKKLEEGDQTQVYYVISVLKKTYGEDILALKGIPDVAGREDYLIKQIIELRDILFNKKISKTLHRHGKELLKSSDHRAEKWKLWCDMFAEHNANGKEEELVAQFLKSDVIRASLSSICSHPANDDEDLYLLQILSFLILPVVKPENLIEFITATSACTGKNENLTKLVVNSVLNLANLIPSANGTDTLAIFPSFFASLELHEKALQCNKLKSSSTMLRATEQEVHKLVVDYSTEHSRSAAGLAEKSKIAEDKISQLDAEIAELQSRLEHQADEIQTTTSALNTKKVSEKAKVDKLQLVLQDRIDYLKIRTDEESKVVAKYELTRIKIETYKKSVSALTTFNKNLRLTLTKLVNKFIPNLNALISGQLTIYQEADLQFLYTKFGNYRSSMREFQSEREIYERLRTAFAQCARSFRILVHNTQILAQSAQILVSILNAREWDAARAQVQEAQERVATLAERQVEMEEQFNISKGGAD